MTKIATVHKVLSPRQTVYKLTPPHVAEEYCSAADDYVPVVYQFVVASCASLGYESEVLIFPSDGEGVTSWGEIGGSYSEGQGHVSALKGLGYKLGGSPEEILQTIRRSGRNAPKASPEGMGAY